MAEQATRPENRILWNVRGDDIDEIVLDDSHEPDRGQTAAQRVRTP